MDQNLLNLIHRHAEDREIDYISAQKIGEMYGKTYNQQTLVEWKQKIDRYLKTFNKEDFVIIEKELIG